MGYFKDNFSGSPAALQRIRLAKGAIVYSIVLGGAILAFSPHARRYRENTKDIQIQQPLWFRNHIEIRGTGLTATMTKKEFDRRFTHLERLESSDWTAPKELAKKQKNFAKEKRMPNMDSSANPSSE